LQHPTRSQLHRLSKTVHSGNGGAVASREGCCWRQEVAVA